ncbi:TonB-dependent receptor [candidate division KSB1 bacterium]|nr:TonB-dependent receptor [candidate division KSB1 bacterium]
MTKLNLLIFLTTLLLFSAGYSENSIRNESDLDSVRVNLEVKDIQLRTAIQHLVSQTKLQIIFNDALVKDIKVNCSIKNTTLRNALETLLKNTKLTFKTMKDGQIVIIKRKTEKKIDIKGFIKDGSSGETLPYANILIKGTSVGTASNMNGYFVLINAPVEDCTLKVHYIGYEDFELLIVADSCQNFLDIKLKQKVLSGHEVTISAENSQVMEVADEPSHFILSPRQISSLPSIGEIDVFRSLQLIPGISSVNEGSTGLFVRGGTPDQNLILYDGMTIYHVDHFFGFASTFNAAAVKDVQVFKGGFPAKFGNRISSVIELTGKSGSPNKFKMGANFNLLSGSGIVQVPINGRGACLLSFRRSYTDYLKSDLYNNILNSFLAPNQSNDSNNSEMENQNMNPNPESQNNPQLTSFTPDFYYYDLIGKFSYLVTNNDLFSLSYYQGYDFLDQSQDVTIQTERENTARTINNISDITEWGNIGLSGKWSRIWNSNIYTNMIASYSRYISESSRERSNRNELEKIENTIPSYSEQNEIRNLTFRLDNEWQVNEDHRIEFGTEFSKNNINLLFTTNDSVRNLDRENYAEQTSFYGQDKWKMSVPLELSFGIRSTYYFPTSSIYFEPRVSFNYSVSKNISIKGAWGEYYQFINRITNENALEGNRDFWLLADERLKPSFAEHKIIGVIYENSDFLFDVEAYYKNLSNIAEFSQRFRRMPGSELGELFFLGDGLSKGVEFLLQKKKGKINGWISYARSKTEYQVPRFNHGLLFPADHDKPHELKIVSNYLFGNWTLSAVFIYSSGVPYTETKVRYNQMMNGSMGRSVYHGARNAKRLPAYQRLDLSLSRKFELGNLAWDIGLSIFNAFDHSNILSREYIMDTDPMTVRENTALGFTPTLNLKIDFN